MDRRTKREELFEKKWEFLRRNEAYRRDWARLKPVCEAKWAKGLPMMALAPEELAFCKKWKISRPLDPALSYDERLMYDPIFPEVIDTDTGKKGPKRLSEILPWGKEDWRRELHRDLTPLEDVPARVVADDWGIFDCDMEQGTVRVEINLRHPEKRLLRELRLIIKEWHQHYLRAQKRATRPAEDRNRSREGGLDIGSRPTMFTYAKLFVYLVFSRALLRRSRVGRSYAGCKPVKIL
jgi:hypothetical protein